jgi:hypothetical protein
MICTYAFGGRGPAPVPAAAVVIHQCRTGRLSGKGDVQGLLRADKLADYPVPLFVVVVQSTFCAVSVMGPMGARFG